MSEPQVTAVTRAVLAALKRSMSADVALHTHEDFGDGWQGTALSLARLPSVTVAGPQLAPDPLYAEPGQSERDDGDVTLASVALPTPVRLTYTLTAASRLTLELLGLMDQVAAFVVEHRWLEVRGVGFPLESDLQMRTSRPSGQGVQVFTMTMAVRGVPVTAMTSQGVVSRETRVEMQVGKA